jgi:hypothetical protein
MNKAPLALAVALACAAPAGADLIAYWNFNASTPNSSSGQLGVLESLAPDAGSGTLTFSSGITLNTVSDGTADGNAGTFAGTTLNAIGGDASGGALTITGGIGGGGDVISNGQSFTFGIDMTGYQDLVVTFATRGTATGFNNNQLSWSTDGVTFTDFGSAWDGRPTSFFLVTRDLSSVDALDNASTVFIRITLDGATSAAGNNRFDNVQFNATLIPAPGAAALLGLGGLIAGRRRR